MAQSSREKTWTCSDHSVKVSFSREVLGQQRPPRHCPVPQRGDLGHSVKVLSSREDLSQ